MRQRPCGYAACGASVRATQNIHKQTRRRRATAFESRGRRAGSASGDGPNSRHVDVRDGERERRRGVGAIKAKCQVRVKHFWPELATKSLREALVLSASALRDGKREREGTAPESERVRVCREESVDSTLVSSRSVSISIR
jgi:hypothetical protein